MINSTMRYVDIIFPVNLRPLTYKCPEGLAEKAKPGMIVSAPLKNRTAKGIILGAASSVPEEPIKTLFSIDGDVPAIGKNLLKLLLWMSEYYLAREGSVLQQTVPKELLAKTKKRKTAKGPRSHMLELPEVSPEDIGPIIESAAEKRYHTFLLHSPSGSYEFSFISHLLNSGAKNVIIIFPEVFHADIFYSAVAQDLKERACLLHGEIPKGSRSEALDGIISGRHDIVIGTRAALFAPLKNVSLIAVLREDCGSYKLEEGIRYNIRDVAVMRGFIEKCAVMLSSVTPSIESAFNALAGKYSLLRPSAGIKRPRIKIIDMRYSKKIRPGISKEVFEAARNKLGAAKKIMFLINRRGYATLLLCRDCGHEERCYNCNIPLVMHKGEELLKCHYCGAARQVPDKCSRCGGHNLELLGSGTQRVQEELEELFGVGAVRFDSDKVRKKSKAIELISSIAGNSVNVVIGTKMLTKQLGPSEKFSLVAVLNADTYMNFPDFRASEKAYRELAAAVDLAGPGGEVMIQTRLPQSSVFHNLKSGDYDAFVKEELKARKELLYPPYSKLLKITVSGDGRTADAVAGGVKDMVKGVEVLGPILSKNKKGEDEFSVLLKSAGRKSLNDAARAVLRKYEGQKGLRIVIDVDPA